MSPPFPPTPALRIEGLSKRFGTTDAVVDLSLTVPPGEVLGFSGPNGAGQSTTIPAAARAAAADRGCGLGLRRPGR